MQLLHDLLRGFEGPAPGSVIFRGHVQARERLPKIRAWLAVTVEFFGISTAYRYFSGRPAPARETATKRAAP